MARCAEILIKICTLKSFCRTLADLRVLFLTQENPNENAPSFLIIGTREGVMAEIRKFYAIGFAQVDDWSRLTPVPNCDRVMTILGKLPETRIYRFIDASVGTVRSRLTQRNRVSMKRNPVSDLKSGRKGCI
uniref:Hypo2 n=1 Tax=Microseira wollei TaxID=467598 RepID=C3RVN3_9CYAN|nr:Hypo2 [Microseira wollei]